MNSNLVHTKNHICEILFDKTLKKIQTFPRPLPYLLSFLITLIVSKHGSELLLVRFLRLKMHNARLNKFTKTRKIDLIRAQI